MTTPSLLEFPCAFTVKTFGKATPEYEIAVLEIIKKHINEPLKEDAVKQRYSKDKNYLALSITINAQSKAQMDAIYQDLTKEPLVTMAL
ncbi:MAG: DUF493 domain-containing protein [Pseudomonadota bacterium]